MNSMEMAVNVLVSIDFRKGKGGISRVARAIDGSLSFSYVFSLYGKGNEPRVRYFNGTRILLLLKIVAIFVTRHPGLIVFDHLNVARVLSLVPAALLKKVVIYLHDEEAWCEVKGLRKLALKKATAIVCNSEYTRKKFLASNPAFMGKTYVCHPGGVPWSSSFVEDKEYSTDVYEWVKDAAPYCLFVSRLWSVHRYKGYLELINAFKKYYTINPEASLRLAIIGNGDDAKAVQAAIEDNRLRSKIALFTEINDSMLATFYKHASCLFFPSVREGFGMVFLEAMYFKKACIGVAGQPAEEIIVHDVTGKLIPDNKESTLVESLNDIEKHPEKYKAFGEAGYKRYLSNFSEENFKIRFQAIIEKA